MNYSAEVEGMTCVAKGPKNGPSPIPQEGKWVQAKEIKDISAALYHSLSPRTVDGVDGIRKLST